MSKTVHQKFFKKVAKKMKKRGCTFSTGSHKFTVCHTYTDRELLRSVGMKVAVKMSQKIGLEYRTDRDGDIYVNEILLVCGSTLYQC